MRTMQAAELVLEHGEDRTPVDAGGLHPRQALALGHEPVGQGAQARGAPGEGARLLLGAARSPGWHRSRQRSTFHEMGGPAIGSAHPVR